MKYIKIFTTTLFVAFCLFHGSLAYSQTPVMFQQGVICDTEKQLVQLVQNIGKAQETKADIVPVQGCGMYQGPPIPAYITKVASYEDKHVTLDIVRVDLPNGMVQFSWDNVKKKEGRNA